MSAEGRARIAAAQMMGKHPGWSCSRCGKVFGLSRLLAIDDKNGINACKLLGIAFTTALGILLRSREKGLIDLQSALSKLAALARNGRYKGSILEDAKLRLEVQR
jgi:hypothetical protein